MRPITPDTVTDLMHMHDETGWVSLYINIAPEQKGQANPPWTTFLKNELVRIEREIRDVRGREAWTQFKQSLAGASDALDLLQDTTAPGIGRVLFLGIASGEALVMTSQMPLPTAATVDDSPFVRHLVEVLDEGQLAGVVYLGNEQVRISSWSMGTLTTLAEYDLARKHELYREQGHLRRRELHLPADTGVTRDNVHRRHAMFLRIVARQFDELSREHGWSRVLIYGAPQHRHDFLEQAQTTGKEVIERSELVIRYEDAELAGRVHEALETATREREQRLIDQITASVQAGGAAVLGLDQTLAMLALGRVDTFVFDSAMKLDLTGLDVPITLSGDPARGIERLIESAYAQGAQVIALDEAAADKLREQGGIGALLRW